MAQEPEMGERAFGLSKGVKRQRLQAAEVAGERLVGARFIGVRGHCGLVVLPEEREIMIAQGPRGAAAQSDRDDCA